MKNGVEKSKAAVLKCRRHCNSLSKSWWTGSGGEEEGACSELLTEEIASGRHSDIKDKMHQIIKQMVLFRLLQ